MMMAFTRSSVLALALSLTCSHIGYVEATVSSSYKLSYDAVISPSFVQAHYLTKPQNQNPADGDNDGSDRPSFSRLIPPTLAQETIQDIGMNLLTQWIDYNKHNPSSTSSSSSDPASLFAGTQIPLGFHCLPQETLQNTNDGDDTIIGGTVCLMDHTSPNFSFQISTTVYQAEGSMSDYFFDDGNENKKKIVEGEDNVEFGDAIPVATRVDITLTANTNHVSPSSSSPGTATTSYARDILVETVPFLTKQFKATAIPGPIWSVDERITPLQMMMKRRNRVSSLSSSSNVFSAEDPASLESLVLSSNAMSNMNMRIPIISSSKQTLESTITSSNDEDDEEDDEEEDDDNDKDEDEEINNSPSTKVDLWHTQNHKQQSTRSLFLNSKLRQTTSTAGIAHAEAFIHPMLNSHPAPRRILLLSQTPNSYLKEILKYHDVEHVTLLGADKDVVDNISKYMPSLNNCSGIEGRDDLCMENNGVVEFIDDSVEEFLGYMIGDEIKDESVYVAECDEVESEDKPGEWLMKCADESMYDVIFMDVVDEWAETMFGKKFLEELLHLMISDSVIVINSGIPPSLDSANGGSEGGLLSPRDRFLATPAKDSMFGVVHVYDEPLAAPLDSAFLVLFPTIGSIGYSSFIQTATSAKELDLISTLRPQRHSKTPTLNYDGYTHSTRYVFPSRSWENWFCDYTEHFSGCSDFPQKWYNASKHSYNTQVKRIPVKGRALHTDGTIPKGNFVLSHDSYESLQLDRFQWDSLNKFVDSNPDAHMFRELLDFFEAYGFHIDSIGSDGWSVSFTNNTFTNHACEAEEATVGFLQSIYVDKYGDNLTFSPLLSRRGVTINHLAVAQRDLDSDEEITIDYSVFRDTTEDASFQEFLNKVCDTGVGHVPVEEEYLDKEED